MPSARPLPAIRYPAVCGTLEIPHRLLPQVAAMAAAFEEAVEPGDFLFLQRSHGIEVGGTNIAMGLSVDRGSVEAVYSKPARG